MLPAVAGFKFKAGENFNHRNTLSILRIALKLHFVQNVEPNAEIGQKGAFCKGLIGLKSECSTNRIPGVFIVIIVKLPFEIASIKIEIVINM